MPKKLWEEIRPFDLFAFCRYGSRSDVRCTPNLNHENYDGRIDFGDASTHSVYVEITYAKDGYDESLRFEHMNASGSVNLLGEISISGTKAAGPRKVHVANEFVDHKETRERALEIVRERIVDKSGKAYGPHHELAVVIDDYVAFRTEEDRTILKDGTKATVEAVQLDFGKVFLIRDLWKLPESDLRQHLTTYSTAFGAFYSSSD